MAGRPGVQKPHGMRPRDDTGLLDDARRLLERNTRLGRVDGRKHRFSLPAPQAYPFQWFWDSCFHAVVWARIDRERAADELRSLLARQRGDGMIPHVVFWDQSRVTLRSFWHYLESRGIPFLRRPATSECVQPPIIAQAVERVGGTFAVEALPAPARYYGYLARERDPDRDGLVSIVNQFESGCWDERAGLFFNLHGRSERRSPRRTIVSLLPLLLHGLPAEVAARLVENLLDRGSFWTRYPVPSVGVNEPSFRRANRLFGFRFIWRGATSLNTDWLLVEGLRRHGCGSEADELAARSRELVLRGGFNEFYDPLDGEPVSAHDFGWATLAAIL